MLLYNLKINPDFFLITKIDVLRISGDKVYSPNKGCHTCVV